jgi:hypothetical protein
MNPPNDILLTYNLYPHGTIEIGYESYRGGMSVGMRPLVARIQVTKDCGLYPDGWFPLHPQKSLIKIKSDILEGEISDTNRYILPKWILLDCYEYHWKLLYLKVVNE